MADAARLAADYPKINFILQHAGMLEDLSQNGRAEWLAGMQRLAAEPNVYCKLSGLGTFIHRNDGRHIADIVRTAIALFGANRCLFGSNFPIEKLWTRYADLVTAYRGVLATFSAAEAADLFWNTASKVYRLALQ
jgi:predicted TIM-barrel fold metal-dependent hydrolase